MKIAVFCGSKNGNNPNVIEAAVRLGKWIGENNYSLVYGGGDAGLMGIIAGEVSKYGCKITGVVPSSIPVIANKSQTYVTDIIYVKDLSERKQVMEELADAFIALPGGPGTLDEISEVIALCKLGVLDKPSVFLDVDGFYSPIRELLDKMKQEGFIGEHTLNQIIFSDDLDEIKSYFESYN